MDFEEYNDLKISDDSTSKGGNYRNVKISGDGTINGDINCKSIGISGDGEINGKVYCEELFRVSGDASIKGSATCGSMKISGDAEFSDEITVKEDLKVFGDVKVYGDIRCGSIRVAGDINGEKDIISKGKISIAGDCEAGGIVKGDEIGIAGDLEECKKLIGKLIKIFGSTHVSNDIEGEKILLKGDVKCDGLVNGEEIYIESFGRSEINEIGGKVVKIGIEENSKLFNIVKICGGNKKRVLHCNTIEGDEIMLKNTVANMVRGKNIIIGENCIIDNLEYSGEISIDEGAVVKRKIKI